MKEFLSEPLFFLPHLLPTTSEGNSETKRDQTARQNRIRPYEKLLLALNFAVNSKPVTVSLKFPWVTGTGRWIILERFCWDISYKLQHEGQYLLYLPVSTEILPLGITLSCSLCLSVHNQAVSGEITVPMATQLIAKLLRLWVPWQHVILHYIGVMSLPVMFCVCCMQRSFYGSMCQPRL